ncbi:uncharacterized protein LOC113849467 [Abrus precatorius]|uniref:Uncharacterized protein LOC113849467 n=1 Tax=Abrus precatorius TaxID=3816 RepID=A0A8B8JUK5_ABRPR|nr:uncharacterized protein LOC113849467 [Abrus precatorius]
MDLIKYIFGKPALTGRIARWQVFLSEYDIVYVTQKAIKGNALADYLAHQPVDDYQSMQCEFPNEDIMTLFKEEGSGKEKWIMLFDGASNALGHGVSAVLISPEKHHIPITARLSFDCTNNVAEYEACVLRIQVVIESKAKILKVFELIKQFDKITFHHIPRKNYQLADALAILASMYELSNEKDMPLIKIQRRDQPAYCQLVEEELDGQPWYHDIKQYIQNKKYLSESSENNKRTLR